MRIDITLKITPDIVKTAQGNEKRALVGHLGTHFDVMDKEFPLDYTERNAIVFDVSHIKDREITISNIDMSEVKQDMFVAFFTGFIEKEQYGSQNYFKNHPQLSKSLIEALVKKKISIIGIDFAGIRRGKEHPQFDQYCADHNVFVVENLCNLKAILDINQHFIANTYPMNYANMTGLPCRVIAKI